MTRCNYDDNGHWKKQFIGSKKRRPQEKLTPQKDHDGER